MKLTLRATKDAPRLSRERINNLRPALEPRFVDVNLIISELVSNSVRHSGVDDQVAISVRVSVDKIWIEVADGGKGFAIDQKDNSGMGLNIVKSLAQTWGVSPIEPFTVWVELAKVS